MGSRERSEEEVVGVSLLGGGLGLGGRRGRRRSWGGKEKEEERGWDLEGEWSGESGGGKVRRRAALSGGGRRDENEGGGVDEMGRRSSFERAKEMELESNGPPRIP